MRSTLAACRRRLGREWPRLIVALVSLYGIYYAVNIIQSTSMKIHTLSSLTEASLDPQSDLLSPTASADSILPFEPQSHPQVRFGPNSRNHAVDTNRSHNERNKHNDNTPPQRTDGNNHLGFFSIAPASAPAVALFGLVRDPGFNLEVDVDGHTASAAIYTLLVISSLSVIDNGIGLMVATRRSLRLTQVAFVIWCLRFLFRILSLVSVSFMLAVGIELRKTHGVAPRSPLDMDMGFNSNGDSNNTINNNNYGSNQHGNDSASSAAPGMIMVTVLEVIVAVVHGWSLLVLIRDLRNQPRPKTAISRLWVWFRGTKCGRRIGLRRPAIGTASGATAGAIDYHHIAGSGSSHYVGCGGGDLESSSRISNGSSSTGSVWNREIAASLGLGNGLLSSASSIRSVAASMSEIMAAPGSVVAGRSRASSVGSYVSCSSTEKM